jgi:hypothetical protein
MAIYEVPFFTENKSKVICLCAYWWSLEISTQTVAMNNKYCLKIKKMGHPKFRLPVHTHTKITLIFFSVKNKTSSAVFSGTVGFIFLRRKNSSM